MLRCSWQRAGIGAAGLVCAVLTVAIVRAAPPDNGRSPVKTLLADEANTLEREIAARMMRREGTSTDRRAKLELEIDLRIIERALVTMTVEAKFPSAEQGAAWLRAKQFREALHGVEEALAQDPAEPTASQKDAAGQIHRLSFAVSGVKGVKDLDDFCRGAAMSLANVVSSSPVNPASIVGMRPRPQGGNGDNNHQATVGELTEQVQQLASISVPLRQQLLALSSAAASASDKEEGRSLYALLTQSIDLARGLQSNTGVTAESRNAIESQLAEGIVLFADPRTRDAGRNRVEALGQYRQTLTRIGRMGLSREQMDQFAPAFAWAQANPESGAKLLATLEQYMDLCTKWDTMPRDVTVPQQIRRPLEELRTQFAKQRAAFMQTASHIGTVTPTDLDQSLQEVKRLYAVTEDLQAMGPSIETLNAYKVKPIGELEKKIATAAMAASNTIASTNRNDAQRYLDAVHTLAQQSRTLAARPLTDIPSPVAQAWAGGKLDAFEARWKAIVAEQISGLINGTLDLDKGKMLRLDGALAMQDAIRTAAQLEAVLPKTPSLAGWVDWAIDPGSLQIVLTPYKEALAGAFSGYAADNLDAFDKWAHLRSRYVPLMTLILRDASYADQCEALPIGFAAQIGRLATPFEGAPFATERYASYAIGVWSACERLGDGENADKVSIELAKRLARDLHVEGNIDEANTRSAKHPKG